MLAASGLLFCCLPLLHFVLLFTGHITPERFSSGMSQTLALIFQWELVLPLTRIVYELLRRRTAAQWKAVVISALIAVGGTSVALGWILGPYLFGA
jgi:hypothetical protein